MDMDKLIAQGAQVVSGSVILNGRTIGQPLKDGTVLLNAEGESIVWEAAEPVVKPARTKRAKAEAAPDADDAPGSLADADE